jgi:hypothetical protein
MVTMACAVAWADVPTCANVTVTLTDDYSYVVGSADFTDPDGDDQSGSTYIWSVNGTPFSNGAVAELLQLHLDGSASDSSGEMPVVAENLRYESGRWGSALALDSDGELRFARGGNLDLSEGTIEMWVAARSDGDDPVYASRGHVLLHYRAPNGDSVVVAQAGDTGVIYAGGTVGGQWQSAYSQRASTRSWRAGEWHHVAYTYSVAGNFMRFYLDGVLMADSNEGHYWLPSSVGTEFSIGADVWGVVAHYRVDEVRISARVATAEEIAVRSSRLDQPRANEVWLDTEQLDPGDSVVFEFTPSDGIETGSPCVSEPLVYPGIPLTDPNPPSTLLQPNTEELSLTIQSIVNTSCRYAVGERLAYASMTAFDSGAGTTVHETVVAGLETDPNVVNDVYVRCAAYPDFVLRLRYRSLSEVNPAYPRTGNLWGWWPLSQKGLEYCARIDLWLGASSRPEEIRELRRLNPDIRILTSINAIENRELSDEYYLKDIYGNPVEVWPGSYRLNMTKLDVAEYQAHYAYQHILDSDLMFDGCFFDNVMTTQSWQDHDIYGNPFLVDSDEDGVVDDPAVFDAAWKAGVFHELEVFRELMPHAIMSGHSMNIDEAGIADTSNGISIGFWSTDVIEGKMSFADLMYRYTAWNERARSPRATMIESSPPDQISYGYDYSPWDNIPASTLEFARTYYPYVRFGLAFTLMNDGFFAHEFGDTWHGNDWWYDELDFYLGYPLGPAERIATDPTPPVNIMENGGFEDAIAYPWSFWSNTTEGCVATVSRDTADRVEGAASARIDISSTSGEAWHIELAQRDRAWTEGTGYDVVFQAKSDVARFITLSAQKGSPDWSNYGLHQRVAIGTDWEEHTVSFTANETTTESRVQFMVGETTGTVWLDDVRVYEREPDMYRREFTNGLVLLNASRDSQTVDVGPGYKRLTGDQAARYEYILDDSDAAFTTIGGWTVTTYDSGEWKAAGPFYHDWGEACHESAGTGTEARWNLSIPEEDTYTVTVWWPAAPSAGAWSQNVRYEIVANSAVVAATTFDQRYGGDEWHLVGDAYLSPADGAFVRASSQDGAPCIADAVHVRSAARYNDGSPAPVVTLQPMDGIVLARVPPADSDGDGLPDEVEVTLGTSVTDSDSDDDGLSDYDEVYWDGDPALNAYNPVTNPSGTDTDPLDPDTDDDGVTDGDEVAQGTNPLRANGASLGPFAIWLLTPALLATGAYCALRASHPS